MHNLSKKSICTPNALRGESKITRREKKRMSVVCGETKRQNYTGKNPGVIEIDMSSIVVIKVITCTRTHTCPPNYNINVQSAERRQAIRASRRGAPAPTGVRHPSAPFATAGKTVAKSMFGLGVLDNVMVGTSAAGDGDEPFVGVDPAARMEKR